MKTFRLKSLEIIENNDKDIIQTMIPLIDGLIIDREDNENQWVIEAYINHDYFDYFKDLQESNDDVMVMVKITKESNHPAVFITSIIEVNKIGDRMNVLFKGRIIDQRKEEIEEILQSLIEKGYQGEELLGEFKQLMENSSV